MILYRPVGLQEMALIYDSGMKAFPARLPQQPIFYPVLQLEYARQTASDWNIHNGQFAGYVTQFKVDDDYLSRFEEHTVGDSQYQELWIPAEEVEEFNQHIVGHIKVIEAYFGDGFQGFIPEKFALQGKNAVEQFTVLANSYLYKRMEFYLEIKRNHKAVFLNFPFWQSYDFKNPGLKEKIVQAIKEAWLTSFPQTPLPPPTIPETPPAARQADAPAKPPIDSVEEEITPEEETDEASWEDSIDDELPPVEKSDPPPLRNPVRQAMTPVEAADAFSWDDEADEDLPPARQTAPPLLRNAAQEEITLQEGTDEFSWEEDDDEDLLLDEEVDLPPLPNTVREENAPQAQTEARVPANPEHDDRPVMKPTEPAPLGNQVRKAPPPIRQSLSARWVNHARDDIPPREPAAAPVPVSPVRERKSLPPQTDSPFKRGIRLGLSGEYEQAIAELSRAIEQDPGDVVAHTSLGVAFHRVGQDDRALACYETALRLDPQHADAHYFRANILYARGHVREAMTGYSMALGLKPQLIEAHAGPAPQDRLTDYSPSPAGMYRIARPAQRILELTRSLDAQPRQASLWKERAAAYARLWNYEQAVADYTSSLAIQPDDASALHSRGGAYEQLGEHDRARQDYQKAIAINSQLSDEYIQRGVDFGRMGNFRQSLASLTEGIRLAPGNPDGYFNRGMTYFQQGDLESAITDFSMVIQLSSKDDTAYYWRGIAYEEAGRRREAIADYSRFLQLSQDAPARREIEQKLRQWNVRQPEPSGRREPVPQTGPGTDPSPSRNADRDSDFYRLLLALGERALRSVWFGSGVQADGKGAEELSALANQERPINGRDLLRLASGIRRMMAGDFYALDPGANAHWIFVRAWEGSGVYVETDDPGIRQRLTAQFSSLEDVQGASPSYEGFFIRF